MSDIQDDDLEAEAQRLADEARKPIRRVRPRLAQALRGGEDMEVQTPNGSVMAWRLGVGPATLLVHGWNDDNALWGPVIDACEHLGRAVVALDLPGHGWSQSEALGVEAAAEAVIAVAEALGPIDSVVAHSFGCPTSITALSQGLQAGRAVMIGSPVPRTKPYEDRFNHDWEREMVNAGEDPEVVARAAQIMKERMASPEAAFAEIDQKIAGMTAKALILHSLDDDAAPYENAQVMADLWPGSELVLTDELGHRLIAQDAATVQRIVDFVEGF